MKDTQNARESGVRKHPIVSERALKTFRRKARRFSRRGRFLSKDTQYESVYRGPKNSLFVYYFGYKIKNRNAN